MRLGQLARRYDVSLQEIISYLNEINPAHEPLHHNSKLDDQIEMMVIEHFDVKIDTLDEQQETVPEDESKKSDDVPVESVPEFNEETEADLQMELDPSLPPIKVQESPTETEIKPKKEHEVIETDRLIELMESEETDIDLSNITLIKAPKKELDGLKVLGKIDLPEPKSKKTKIIEEQEEVPSSDRKDKTQRSELDTEEKEARRLKFKERREKYDAQQANLEREKQQKENKALKKARYEQQVRRTRPVNSKQIDLIPEEQEPIKITEQRPMPKTIFGKFWRWLDASSK